jgi:thymidylate synthase
MPNFELHPAIQEIRHEFARLLNEQQFTSVNRESSMTGLVGSSTIEIVGASFVASEDSIFGEVNWDYVQREEEWYNSMDRCVHSIPGGAPQIWRAVADRDGMINSNYGWAIYSPENGFIPDINIQSWRTTAQRDRAEKTMTTWAEGFGSMTEIIELYASSQYSRVLEELKKNPESRRAVMIYTRPSMWLDYNKNGRSDFMCTNTVQYLQRGGKLHAIVQMRSNDAIFGYRNDRAWQAHVLQKLSDELGVEPGIIHWQVGSLHVYARHYYLVDHYVNTGSINITKQEYMERYPDSPYASI